MKWEIYKKMTLEHRVEWDYRFKENLKWEIGCPWVNIMIIWMTISTAMLIWFISMKEYLEVPGAVEIVGLATSISGVMLVVWCLEIVLKVGVLIFWNIKANKWLKQNGYK